MQLNLLKARTKRITSARVGRGGKRGKTSGRGGKGQTARAGHKMRPEMRDILKKIPKRRGYGKNRSRTVRGGARVEFFPVNIATLEEVFSAGDTVNQQTLAKKGIIHSRTTLVKVLGTGELTKALALSGVATSVSAKAAIEKAGGSVVHA